MASKGLSPFAPPPPQLGPSLREAASDGSPEETDAQWSRTADPTRDGRHTVQSPSLVLCTAICSMSPPTMLLTVHVTSVPVPLL